MKKVTVTKNGIVSNEALLPDLEANEWAEKHRKMGSFGRDDYYEKEPNLLQAEVLDADGNVVTPAQYEMESVLIEPEVTEEQEVLQADGTSYDPKQYQTVVIEPAIYEDRIKFYDVLKAPAEFVITITDVTLEVGAEDRRKEKISKGRPAREACEMVLDLIAGYNLDRVLTMEQITQMQTTFADSEKALKSNRPTQAKGLISAIVVDDVLVTQQMKDDCLSLLANY